VIQRVAVTSAVRYAGQAEFSGFLRIVDLVNARVVATSPVPESSHRADDPNPRGGLRGAKGIGVAGGRFVLANSDTLFLFDDDWRRTGVITHPWLGGIHDLLVESDGIWVTAANTDLLVRMSWDGEVLDWWSWRADPALVSELGFGRVPPFDRTLDYRDPRVMQGGVHNVVHLNGVSRSGDGLAVSFGRILARRTLRRRQLKGRAGRLAGRLGFVRRPPAGSQPIPATRVTGTTSAIVLLSDKRPRAGRVALRDRGLQVPNHNVLVEGELLVYNDTNHGRLVAYDRSRGAVHRSVAIPGSPSFARGLLRLGEGLYAVGSQAPLALHVVDLDRGVVSASVPLGGIERESVYAVCGLPQSFAEPATGFDLRGS
jgi:hypothetical protein